MAESGPFVVTLTVLAGVITGLAYSKFIHNRLNFSAPPSPPTPRPRRNIRTVIQQVPQIFYMNDPEPKQLGGQAQVISPGKVAIGVGSLVIVSVLLGGWLKSN